MTKTRSIILFIVALFFFSCTTSTVKIERPLDSERKSQWAEGTLNKLTLREKISQMLIYSMHLDYRSSENQQWKDINKLVETEGIGGFHLWSGNAGLSVTMLNELQRKSKVPILVDMDIEKGMQQRFPEGTQIPPLMAIAATGNTRNAFTAGQIIAREGRSVGVHWNFSPVVDVNNNADNPIINTRAFSDDPDIVADYATQYIKGLQSGGMLATAKHFPGHGDTKTDSHRSLATIPSDSARLWNIELAPYKKVIEEGVDAVMISHLIAPEFQPNSHLPATLSKFWIQDILRTKLGFRGAVVTDAMDMGGVTNGYSDDFALVTAINAGCDIIIQRHNYIKAIDIIENAVNKGYVSEERINEAALQMLILKEKAGLHLEREVKFNTIQGNLGLTPSQREAEKIAQQSITLVKNKNNLLPIKISNKLTTTVIDIYGSKYNHNRSDAAKTISKYRSNYRYYAIDEIDKIDYINSIVNGINKNSLVILNVFAKPRAWKGSVALNKTQAYLVNSVQKRSNNVVMISFGNPYIIRDFPQTPSYLCAWESQSNLQNAAANALFRNNSINGKLPINIPMVAKRGSGIKIAQRNIPPSSKSSGTKKSSTVLKRTMSYEVNADINSVNKLLNQAVEDSAFPGGVLLAAKDANIFLHDAFGNHTYSKNEPVGLGNIFDIASLTKVIVTTSAIMKLYDSSKINLNDPVGKFIPEFVNPKIGNTETRKKVTVKHLLTHSSGLPPFKQYYLISGSVDKRLQSVYTTKLETNPDQKYVYSDVGFIILGKIVERITGVSLDKFVKTEVFDRLGMTDTYYNPPTNKLKRIIPTEYDKSTGRFIKGVVHDENANSLGGISGHAGLFSTANNLAIFSQMMLNGGHYDGKRIFKQSTMDLFTKINDEKLSSRCLGWDSPSGTSSGGVYLFDASFGHTGFTGTSLWIDPDNKLFVILLTNAVHPSREWKYPKYFDWRQRIHSAVYESLGFTKQNPNLKWRKNWNDK